MPRKEFESFTRLDASDVNTFLMDQSVQTFAGTAARGSAIATPVEGMVTYLNDIDSLSVYNGTAFTTDRTIQVFAGTAARGSAIGTAVEGMYTHLNDTDTLQYWDGSSWVALGNSGLVLVATATPTAVSSVSINNCFTSTYENYKVVITQTAISGSADFTLRLRAVGTDTTTDYVSQLTESYTSSVVTTANPSGTDDWYIGRDSDVAGTTIFDIFRPQTATRTDLMGSGVYLAPGAVYVGQQYNNVQTSSTQFDGFTLLKDNSFTGTIRVYGYSNS
jgi:hypothetical protein